VICETPSDVEVDATSGLPVNPAPPLMNPLQYFALGGTAAAMERDVKLVGPATELAQTTRSPATHPPTSGATSTTVPANS
jgi:hypothetical protein